VTCDSTGECFTIVKFRWVWAKTDGERCPNAAQSDAFAEFRRKNNAESPWSTSVTFPSAKK